MGRYRVCDAKYGRLGRPYDEEIKERDDECVLSIVKDDRYKNSNRPDLRYWYRLASREVMKRGLT